MRQDKILPAYSEARDRYANLGVIQKKLLKNSRTFQFRFTAGRGMIFPALKNRIYVLKEEDSRLREDFLGGRALLMNFAWIWTKPFH